MMRAILHIGLAAAIVFAPVLCCCKAGLFRPAAEAAHAALLPAPSAESCYLKAKSSCCRESQDTPKPATPKSNQPQPASPQTCACCERPDAAETESKPVVSAAEPTGELLPLVHAAHAAGSPEHLGQFRRGNPPGWTSVDVRFAALYERHVLRC